MTIKAVIWDVGGVLVRTVDFSRRDALAERLGMTRQEIDQFVFHGATGNDAQCGRISGVEHWDALRQALKLDAAGLEAFRQEFFAGDVLDLDLVRRIQGLRARYKTAILSNAFSDLRQLLDIQWGLAGAFDVTIVSAEVGAMKPDPIIYQACLEQLDVLPSEAVFIDDFQRNVDGALAVGLHAIRFVNPRQTWRDLNRLLTLSE